MWAIAGMLLGLVILTSLVGFHTGPHSHAVAVILGGVTAVWLFGMALAGQSSAILWLLFGADVALSTGVGVAAYKGLKAAHETPALNHKTRLEGMSGTAETDLDPEGRVKIRGESWSAISLNGRIPAGSAVQVINERGIRLEVWGEEGEPLPPPRFSLDPPVIDGPPEDHDSSNRRAGS